MNKVFRFLILLSLLFSFSAKVNVTPARAAGIWVVTNTSDAGPGSLRHAIENSIAGDTVNFDASLSGQTIITTGILIDHDLLIDGRSLASHVKISGNNVNWSFIAPRCTIQEGCLVPATVTISGLDIINGGIINQMSGTMYISNVNFTGNHVTQSMMGGAITNRGYLTISNSTFSNNTSTAGAGAIYSSGELFVETSIFTNNQGTGGGAIYSSSYLSIQRSTLSNNQAGSGGAVNASGAGLFIYESQFTGNHATALGGGVYSGVHYNAVNVISSTFSGNTAAAGGAIYNLNQAPQSMWIENSTIFNNSNTGVFNEGGSLKVINSTIVGNSTIDNTQGSGIYGYLTSNPPQTVEISNTILAGNTGAPDCHIQGLDFLGGSNLIQNNAAGVNACGTPSLTGDPQLGPLQINGGPTPTLKPQPGSPVVDSADNISCYSYDQRGFPRSQDGDGNGSAICDMGAVEVEASPVSAFSITRLSSNPNWESSVDFEIFFSESVTGVDSSDFTLTTSGDVTGAFIMSAGPTLGGLSSSYTVTVNTGSGNGVIRLNVVDDNSIADRDGNPLGGPLAGDGNFSGGEAYAMVRMAVTFTDQLFRTSNPPITILFPNTTAADLPIGTLGVTGGASKAAPNTAKSFFIENDNCSGATIPPGQSCTFQVRFLPWSLGAKSGTVLIPYTPFGGSYGISFSGNSIPGSQLLSNRSFDTFSPSTQLPDLWDFSGLKPGLDVVDPSWAFYGPVSFKFVGDGSRKILSQTINKPGNPGDDFSFSIMTSGSAIPTNSQHWLMQIRFLNNGSTVENRNILLPTGTFNNIRLSGTYTAKNAYDQILFRIHYAKNSGTAWVDLASLQWAP